MLTDAKIRTLPLPKKGRKKYADGGGLSLLVSPSGGKVWYLRKRVDGKEQMINLGQYPAVGLADARRAAADVSARLANGLPAKEKSAPLSLLALLQPNGWPFRHQGTIRPMSGILHSGLSAISYLPLPVAP